MAEFELANDDRTALAGLRERERVTRAVGVLTVSVLIAVSGYLVVDGPSLWIALPVVAIWALGGFWMSMTWIRRGSGSVARVLAGGRPVHAVDGTMTRTDGDRILPWTLVLDEPVGGMGFVYFGVSDPEWLLSEGGRFRLFAFRDSSPFDGVVCVRSLADDHREWMLHVQAGTDLAYRAECD